MRNLTVAAALLAIAGGTPAEARRNPPPVWTVDRTSDPITGVARCMVAMLDGTRRTRFTRTGGLYPVIEMNSQLGLLIGVSSGGTVRLPTGDIVWRIDDRPFRTLKAADNPVENATRVSGGDIAAQTMHNTMADFNRMTAALMATSTMASGKVAREMLDEMLTGSTLIYRQDMSQSAFGLANPRANEVGYLTREGQAPIPLDGSFRAGLQACGIVGGNVG